MKKFNYAEAFQRNLGLLSELEQNILKHKRVAIAGMGGVGGIHLLSLVRAGIANFHIADFDRFGVANFNRQVGATVSSLDKEKVQVLKAMAEDINPEVNIKVFPEGIQENNIDEFLKDVDLFVDGFDAFEINIRRKVFAKCYSLGIPAATAAPIGFSTAYMVFLPKRISFDDFLKLNNLDTNDQLIHFLWGINPFGKQLSYVIDKKRINIEKKAGPSNIAACELCAGVMTIEAIKILLHRSSTKPAPYCHLIDPYLNRYVCKKLRGGNGNFKQIVKLKIIKKILLKKKQQAYADTTVSKNSDVQLPEHLKIILDNARYTPSGDNQQPWQFQITDNDSFQVHIDKSKRTFYELIDDPFYLTAGMLLTNIKISAQQIGYTINYTIKDTKDNLEIFVHLNKDKNIYSSLFDFIKLRSVNRKYYMNEAIPDSYKKLCEEVLTGFKIFWFESTADKLKLGQLTALSTTIRLNSAEAFKIHQSIIAWENNDSSDKIPANTFPLDFFSRKMFQLSLRSWKLSKLLNFIGGTLIPKIELDILPALLSGACFLITPGDSVASSATDLIDGGQKIQEFWLFITQLGLVMQPIYAPVIFADYFQRKIPFPDNSRDLKKAETIAREIQILCAGQMPLFMGRIGWPRSHKVEARSTRKSLSELITVSKNL